MTDIGHSPGVRDRRKSSRVAGGVVLVVVALALLAASVVVGVPALLWAGLACILLAVVLFFSGHLVRRRAPDHAEHPRLTHEEDDHP